MRDLALETKSLFLNHSLEISTMWTQEVVQGSRPFRSPPRFARDMVMEINCIWFPNPFTFSSCLTLLRECGVSIDTLIDNIQNHQHFKWLAAELGASA